MVSYTVNKHHAKNYKSGRNAHYLGITGLNFWGLFFWYGISLLSGEIVKSKILDLMQAQEKLTEQQIREAANNGGVKVNLPEFRLLAETGNWQVDFMIDKEWKDEIEWHKQGFASDEQRQRDRDEIEEKYMQTPWEIVIDSFGIWDGPDVDGAGKNDSGDWEGGLEDVIELWKEGKVSLEII